MSPEFAASITDVRLTQTAHLLEWLAAHVEADVEAVHLALAAVLDAQSIVRGLALPQAVAS